MIGHPLRRLEDPRLVRGEGAYVDDAPLEGGWHAVFVRSVEAHAFVRSIKLEDFAPEGARMFTAADLGLTEPMPVQHPSPRIQQPTNAPPLATTEVCYVGQPIAVVVARSMHDAVDAVEAVTVEDEELAPILDYRKALAPESPIAHAGAGSNLIAQLTAGYGDVGEAMARAPHTTTFEVDQHRGAGASLETRGVVASWHEDEPQLVIRTSSQSPHAVRGAVASYLGLSPDDVRVVTPDVGGGFGPKAVVYPEEYVLAALARHLGESVKWVEGRREHFTATLHQRGQGGTVEAGFDDDGKILALRARLIHDFGAFVPYGVVVPITTLRLISGPYVIPAVDVRIDCVFTNATPTAAIRGAGRPNAVFVTERVMDAIAHETGIDRAEVRRRNFIPTGALPYRIDLPGSNGKWVEYDSGDYERALDQAMATAEVADFERRKTASKGNGMRRGYGMASYVEDTGVGPYDGARVEVLPNGEVLLEIGTSAQGQGHATVYAQIVAQHLGVSPEMVRVRAGDTQRYGQGMGTVASRTAQGAASAVHVAAAALVLGKG